MKKLISFLSVCLFVVGTAPAFALTINVWDVTTELAQINAWKAAQKGSVHVLEDFEDIDTGWYTEKETGVGTFTAGGLIGEGATSYNKDNDNEFSSNPYFSIKSDDDSNAYGRSNTTTGGEASQWLDSGDITLLTLTLKDDSLKNLFFYIQDPADSGALTMLFVNHVSNYSIFASNQNKASFFVGITLDDDDEPLSSLVWLTTSQSDGFGLDDFSTIHNPEPATMLLFGFGLIGIAGITRKFT
nr:PEP-CTERM sorting domain-containing protein [uncultured Desulfobacter sp.]